MRSCSALRPLRRYMRWARPWRHCRIRRSCGTTATGHSAYRRPCGRRGPRPWDSTPRWRRCFCGSRTVTTYGFADRTGTRPVRQRGAFHDGRRGDRRRVREASVVQRHPPGRPRHRRRCSHHGRVHRHLGQPNRTPLSDLELDPPYLDAWCHLREAERAFTLSRIHGVMPA